mgnify:CR=1 FL=1
MSMNQKSQQIIYEKFIYMDKSTSVLPVFEENQPAKKENSWENNASKKQSNVNMSNGGFDIDALHIWALAGGMWVILSRTKI